MYRFPWQPPLQINSEHLELFEFIERTSPDENSWLMFSTQQLGQYVSGMICRGNTSASNRSYYKAEPLFLEELNSLVKEISSQSLRQRQTTAGRQRTARQSPHAAIAVPPGVSRTAFPRPSAGDGLYRRALRRMRLPAPQGAVRAVRQPSAPYGIAPREAGLACGAFRATAPPLPAPARLQHGPRSPCLGRERPFGNRGKRKKA